MRIRSELASDEGLIWSGGPVEAAELRTNLNPDLYSPPHGEELALVRDHIMEHPEGVLLDAYQAATELELKYPSGSMDAQQRYLTGLRDEVAEGHQELLEALREHPHRRLAEATDGPESTWILTVLDENRLRFTHLSPDRKKKCLGELGDILWYTARASSEAGIRLTDGLLALLEQSEAGKVREHSQHGFADQMASWSTDQINFELAQEIALSQKFAYRVTTNVGTPMERKESIDSAPHVLLGRIWEEDLQPVRGAADSWDVEKPYTQLPDFKATVGKLVWFTAYAAHSLLNTEFSTVMQANLQKITARSTRGTMFSRQDRGEQDESRIQASRLPRAPMG